MKTSLPTTIAMLGIIFQANARLNAQSLISIADPISLIASLGTNTSLTMVDEANTRYDLVDENYRPTSYSADALLRVVKLMDDGGYLVRVVSADGTLRMTGSYADAALTMPDGDFEFYHANGQLESSGSYQMGNKDGIWERYAWDGSHLAERLYKAQTWEQLQASLGEAVEACTIDPEAK